MKPKVILIVLFLLSLAFAGGFFFRRTKPIETIPSKLTLEQILSIRELHMVKHTYNDLFFLHKQNDKSKAIRAIVYVPVEITAYLDLREVTVSRQGDSIKKIALPRARLNSPVYQIDKMVIRETRSLHLHVGKDVYPTVSRYLQTAITGRMDSLRTIAIANRILLQAEEEAKTYIEELLRWMGRSDVVVTVGSTTQPQAYPPPPTTSRARVVSDSL